MRCIVHMLVILSVFGQFRSVAAQETSTDKETEKAHSAEAIRLAKEEAPRWEFFLGEGEKTKAILRTEPLQRWSNALRGTEHGENAIPDGIVFGDVYIWTHQGRPQVVMSIHTYMEPGRHTTRECHSLALDKLTGVRRRSQDMVSGPTGRSAQTGSRRNTPGRHPGSTTLSDAGDGSGILRRFDRHERQPMGTPTAADADLPL